MGSLERFVHCRKFRSKHYGWLVDDPSRGTFHNAITRIVSYFDSPATTLFFWSWASRHARNLTPSGSRPSSRCNQRPCWSRSQTAWLPDCGTNALNRRHHTKNKARHSAALLSEQCCGEELGELEVANAALVFWCYGRPQALWCIRLCLRRRSDAITQGCGACHRRFTR